MSIAQRRRTVSAGLGFTRRIRSVRCTVVSLVVESQDICWVLRDGGIVHGFRLFWRGASRIARVEVPESHWKMVFYQAKE